MKTSKTSKTTFYIVEGHIPVCQYYERKKIICTKIKIVIRSPMDGRRGDTNRNIDDILFLN